MTFDLKAAKERCAFLSGGHGVARDITQPGPDADEEWCVDSAGGKVAYCLGEQAEAYAAFFANALTDFPRALGALEEAWAENSQLRLAVQTALNRLNYEGSYYATRCHQAQLVLGQVLRAAEEG